MSDDFIAITDNINIDSSDIAASAKAVKTAYDRASTAITNSNSAIKSITRSGTTFTYTKVDGTTGTFTQQDNNTTYSAGTGISLSGTSFSLASVVTAGNAGPTANASPAFGGTFTVPYITYDAYGRVTGRTNRTITLPAAPTSVDYANSAWSATVTPNVVAYETEDGSATLPSGGTWAYTFSRAMYSGNAGVSGTASGGTTITSSDNGKHTLFAIRIA